MPDNDLTGGYLAERQAASFTPAQKLRQSVNPGPAPVDPGKEPFSISPGKITKDIFSGIIESPRQVVGGIFDAAKEAGEALTSVFDALNVPSIIAITDEKGEIDISLMTGEEFKEKGGKTAAQRQEVKEPRSGTGGFIRGVAQFLTGFLPASKVLKGVGPATKLAQAGRAALAGAAADVAVFDPHEERLSNLVERYPALSNPVTEFFSAKPEDSEALGRFKNAVEGLGLGLLSEGFIQAARGIRANRIRKLQVKATEAEKSTISKLAKAETGAAEKGFKPFDAPSEKPDFKVGSKKAGEERALNINLDNLETEDDVKGLIENVGKVFSKDINEARRQIITNEETEKLAEDLGMTVADLLSRRRGEAFNAEQAIASRKILVASGENLVAMAKEAEGGSEVALISFRRAMAQHHAIQSQVSGLTAEAGRALQSFRIRAKSEAEQTRLIAEALEIGGGSGMSRKMAQLVSQLDTSLKVNNFTKLVAGATKWDMVIEAWINSLLSSPTTHSVNFLGNSLTVGWAVGERKVASMIGRSLDVQSIPEGETTAQMFGIVQGAKDGMQLAWQVFKSGDPIDPISKIEVKSRRAITAENLELYGIPGRFAHYLGESIRIPGRALMASDELFRSIGYRMELNAQAFRQASSEGLEGGAMAARINDIIQNPPENIKLGAIETSRYQTFQKPLGKAGKAAQMVVNNFPPAKIIVPFMRTPTNIMKYAGERTVLAPLSANVRQEIAAGGARRDLALAKIATGSMIMAAAADYTLSGQITGQGPTNPQMRRIWRLTHQPYSIKFGNRWVAYGRLDPVGATIGMSADMADIMGGNSEADGLDLATSAVIAVAQNATSKTYLRGVSEFFDVMANISPDPERSNARLRRWTERLVGTVVPSGVAHLERVISPGFSSTEGFIDKIRSRTPWWSEGLPPARNIFGEVIVPSVGLGPDIISPIYTKEVVDDPVAEEIFQQGALLRMPKRVIGGVRLDPEQYDKYIRLYSGENNRFVKQPLKRELKQLFRTEQYRGATDGQEGGKSMLIRATFEAYRESAKQSMIESIPALQRDIRKKKTKRAIKLGANP